MGLCVCACVARLLLLYALVVHAAARGIPDGLEHDVLPKVVKDVTTQVLRCVRERIRAHAQDCVRAVFRVRVRMWSRVISVHPSVQSARSSWPAQTHEHTHTDRPTDRPTDRLTTNDPCGHKWAAASVMVEGLARAFVRAAERSSNPIQRSTRHSQERPVLPRDRQEHPGPRRERVQQSPRAAARRPARCSVACGARAAGCAAYVVSERTGLSRRRRHRSSRCAHAHRRAASRTRARTHAGASLASAPGSRLSAGRAAQAKELSKRLTEARASACTTPHARAYIFYPPGPAKKKP